MYSGREKEVAHAEGELSAELEERDKHFAQVGNVTNCMWLRKRERVREREREREWKDGGFWVAC